MGSLFSLLFNKKKIFLNDHLNVNIDELDNINFHESGFIFHCVCCDKNTKVYEYLLKHTHLNGDLNKFNIDLHLILYNTEVKLDNKITIFNYLVDTNRFYNNRYKKIKSNDHHIIDLFTQNYTVEEAYDLYSPFYDITKWYNTEYEIIYCLRKGENISNINSIRQIISNKNLLDIYGHTLDKSIIIYSNTEEDYEYFHSRNWRFDYNSYNISNSLVFGIERVREDAKKYVAESGIVLEQDDLLFTIKWCKHKCDIDFILDKMHLPDISDKVCCENISYARMPGFVVFLKRYFHYCQNCINSIDKTIELSKLGVEDIDDYVEKYIDDISYEKYIKHFSSNKKLSEKFNTLKAYLGDVVNYF